MNLAVIGINHRQSVTFREALAFHAEQIPQTLHELTANSVLTGAVILSTCNRVEVYFTSETPFGHKRVFEVLSLHSGIDLQALETTLYHYEGTDAIRHALRVCSGVDSIVLGEPQILEQTKLACQTARDAGSLGPLLGHFFERVFAIAKKLRTETGINNGSVSTSRAAVELIRERFGDLSDKRVLVIGAGKIGTLAARYFDYYGVQQLILANRTYARAEATAALFGAEAIRFERIPSVIAEVDVIVSCTSADGLILTREMFVQARAVQPHTSEREQIIVDLAVPRDVDPQIGDLEGVHLFNVDMLDAVMDTNREKRRAAAEEILAQIDVQVEKCLYHMRSREVSSMIQSIRQQAEQLRVEALERGGHHLTQLSESEQEAVDYVTRVLVNKLLHAPINYIKQQADSAENLEVVQQLFGIADRP